MFGDVASGFAESRGRLALSGNLLNEVQHAVASVWGSFCGWIPGGHGGVASRGETSMTTQASPSFPVGDRTISGAVLQDDRAAPHVFFLAKNGLFL